MQPGATELIVEKQQICNLSAVQVAVWTSLAFATEAKGGCEGTGCGSAKCMISIASIQEGLLSFEWTAAEVGATQASLQAEIRIGSNDGTRFWKLGTSTSTSAWPWIASRLSSLKDTRYPTNNFPPVRTPSSPLDLLHDAPKSQGGELMCELCAPSFIPLSISTTIPPDQDSPAGDAAQLRCLCGVRPAFTCRRRLPLKQPLIPFPLSSPKTLLTLERPLHANGQPY